jgi:hypothetical protein
VKLQAQAAAQEQRAKELEARLRAYKPVERTIRMDAARRFAPTGPRAPIEKPGVADKAEFVINGPGGKPVATIPTPTPTDRAQAYKVRQATVDYRTARGIFDKMIADYEKNGAVVPGSDLWNRRASMASALTIAVKNPAGLGALAGPDMQIVEDQIGGKIARGLGDPTKARNARAQFDAIMEQTLDGAGLDGASVRSALLGKAPKPQARPTPAAVPASPGPGWQRATAPDGRTGWGRTVGKDDQFMADPR